MARTSKYSPELASKIYDLLASGHNRTEACQSVNISQGTFANWLRNYCDFCEGVDKAERSHLEKLEVEELTQFRIKSLKSAKVTAAVAERTLAILVKRFDSLSPDQITPGMIAGLMRAASTTIETASALWAEAIGINELRRLLNVNKENGIE